MKILGIESSCDDTSVALVECSEHGFNVLAEKTASQIDIHKKYGGVVPEIAGREHAAAIMPVIEAVMQGQDKPDAIAVTAGPGLITGLVIGVEAAKNLAYLWNIPLIRTNHMDGHVHSVELISGQSLQKNEIQFPALCLLVSGGHTELLLSTEHGAYEKLGKTRDDAAGECFDKVAKLLGLEYPGGPKISLLAKTGQKTAIPFPRPMLKENNFDFSFAGLKTAALYWLRDNSLAPESPSFFQKIITFLRKSRNITLPDFCASFEQAIVDVLVEKTCRAAKKYKPKTIVLGGGVSANERVRESLRTELQKIAPDSILLVPEKKYAMDNGAMIAVAGFYQMKNRSITWQKIQADPNWEAYQK
jgi:N6-L-threonylcarbamoyladenine synthase